MKFWSWLTPFCSDNNTNLLKHIQHLPIKKGQFEIRSLYITRAMNPTYGENGRQDSKSWCHLYHEHVKYRRPMFDSCIHFSVRCFGWCGFLHSYCYQHWKYNWISVGWIEWLIIAWSCKRLKWSYLKLYDTNKWQGKCMESKIEINSI